MTTEMKKAIVILHSFGPYARGDLLTDPATISAILSGGHASMAIQTQIMEPYPAEVPVGGL